MAGSYTDLEKMQLSLSREINEKISVKYASKLLTFLFFSSFSLFCIAFVINDETFCVASSVRSMRCSIFFPVMRQNLELYHLFLFFFSIPGKSFYRTSCFQHLQLFLFLSSGNHKWGSNFFSFEKFPPKVSKWRTLLSNFGSKNLTEPSKKDGSPKSQIMQKKRQQGIPKDIFVPLNSFKVSTPNVKWGYFSLLMPQSKRSYFIDSLSPWFLL